MVTCPACGQENPESSRFCGMCGAALVPAAAPPREERKVVTILFTDLVGSTARAEGLDPEDVSATLSAYYAQLRAELERHGGTVEKFIGDAVMAVFGAPVAHEDDAERAVRAALAIRDSIGEELQIRTAVNTGEALVALGAKPGEGDAMVAGDVVNTAARLQGAAPVNGILVGEGTYRATRQTIEYREAPPVEAKGKAEPVKVWEAVSAPGRASAATSSRSCGHRSSAGSASAACSPTLSRTRARSSRLSSSRSSASPGSARAASSRSCIQIVEADPDLISWRQGRSLPYGERVSFWALGEIVKAHAGILESDDAAAAEGKLDAMVEALSGGRARAGMARPATRARSSASRARSAPSARRRSRRGAGCSRRRPSSGRSCSCSRTSTGPTTGSSTSSTTSPTGRRPFRSSSSAPRGRSCSTAAPGWGGGKRNAFTLSIGALTDEETAVLLQRLLDRTVLDAEAQQAVLQRAEGNPLYAEEYARMLAEHADGDLPLPETVQGLIAARIDGLARGGEGAAAGGLGDRQGLLAGGSAGAAMSACSTRSSGRSSSAATAAPRLPARRSTPSSMPSSGTSRTARFPARSVRRSTAARRNGSALSPATAPRTTPRCSPTTTTRRSGSARPPASTRPLCASRPGRRSPKGRSVRCRSTRALQPTSSQSRRST